MSDAYQQPVLSFRVGNVLIRGISVFFRNILSFVSYLWLTAGVTYGVVASLRGTNSGAVAVVANSLRSVPSLLLIMVGMVPLMILGLIPFLGILIIIGLFIWLCGCLLGRGSCHRG